jgi:hypothetical protein
MMGRSFSRLLWAFLFLFTSTIVFAETSMEELVLKQVHVITRHGARQPLSKQATTLSENGGVSLTPIGEKQMYDLGVYLRNRYNTLHPDANFFDRYDPDLAAFESSSLERTMVSANSLALGLFPPSTRFPNETYHPMPVASANIPVYTKSQDNDIRIRAQDNCVSFQEELDQLYISELWHDLERENMGLLEKLVEYFPKERENNGNNVHLENLWNVYDAIHVAKTECEPDALAFSCTQLKNPEFRNVVNDQEWARLQALAHEAEILKYGTDTASNLLGSNLLWQILSRVSTNGQFFLYSAHYSTILSMFVTLQQQELLLSVLPDYAAALIFEFYEDRDGTEFFMKVWYKEGYGSDDIVQLPLEAVCDNAVACSVKTVLAWAEQATITTEEEWCEKCGNLVADVCMRNALEQSADTCLGEGGGLVLGSFFVEGMLAGMLVLVLLFQCCRSLHSRTMEGGKQEEGEGEMEPVEPAIIIDPEAVLS